MHHQEEKLGIFAQEEQDTEDKMAENKKTKFEFEVKRKDTLKSVKLSPLEIRTEDLIIEYLGTYEADTGRIIHNFKGTNPELNQEYIYTIWDGNLTRVEGDVVFANKGVLYGRHLSTNETLTKIK